MTNASEVGLCPLEHYPDTIVDPRIAALIRINDEIILPSICCLGVIGNILNLVVLTRRNMQGTAYIYMRGYVTATLLAILSFIPVVLMCAMREESVNFSNWFQAFYHAHLESFLANACIGAGVMMLLILTVERYVCVCHLGQPMRPLCGPPHLIVVLITITTFLIHVPCVFLEQITYCRVAFDGSLVFQINDNDNYLNSLFYHVHNVVLEVVFKVIPTILLVVLNFRIITVYRRTCKRRREMKLSRMNSKDEDTRMFPEERRLFLLLNSTSLLFLVCVSPMTIFSLTFNGHSYSPNLHQLFQMLATSLEFAYYSITFYIYCLFSKDFRDTFIGILQCNTNQVGRNDPIRRSPISKPITTATSSTTTLEIPGPLIHASV